MKHLKILSIKETQLIYGGTTHSGKYYGNGVYCTKNKCTVDWAKATTCIAGMVYRWFFRWSNSREVLK
ncbi:TPA: class II bacteriocin [Enterococcus faecium]|nr:class II bacteriocin [Enterococcus faecium]